MEIADLVGSHHHTVMTSIERLAVRGGDRPTPIGGGPIPSGQFTKVYVFEGEQDKITLPPMVVLHTALKRLHCSGPCEYH